MAPVSGTSGLAARDRLSSRQHDLRCRGGRGIHQNLSVKYRSDRAPSVEAGSRGAAEAWSSGPALPPRLEVTA